MTDERDWEVPVVVPGPGPYLITREALDNFQSWLREAQQLRPILTDLIAELRHRHTPYRVCMECDDWYSGCEDHEHITVCLWCCTSHGYHSMDCADNHTGTTLAEHCVTVGMADRAEQRLKEVQGE